MLYNLNYFNLRLANSNFGQFYQLANSKLMIGRLNLELVGFDYICTFLIRTLDSLYKSYVYEFLYIIMQYMYIKWIREI